ncbi:MAG: ABC transporter permease, partial [Galactobacter sp.]
AIPNFLVGVLLIAFFSISLGWFPSGGWAPLSAGADFVRHITLPVIALATVQASVLTRYVRSAVLEIMREDFIRTGRSKGLTATGALVRHGLRNAGIPVLTVVGVQLATLMVGAVVIERVFAIPGLGSYLIDSVGNRDLLAVQAVVTLLVLVVIVINLLIDLAYTLLDPRMRRTS